MRLLNKAVLMIVVMSIAASAQLRVIQNRSGAAPIPAAFVGESHDNPAGSSTTVATPSTLNVSAGDWIGLMVGAAWVPPVDTPTAVCGADTMTLVKTNADDANDYEIFFFVKENASANATATCTVTLGATARSFTAIAAANYHGLLTSSSVKNTSCNSTTCDTVAATSTSRTAQNVTTTTANVILIGVGVDWDGADTHTGANSFTRRIGSGAAGSTPFWLDKVVSSTGTYPNGDFSTVGSTQQYMSMFITVGTQ